jgi:nucleotide-binding universal stress UspA family protein
MIDRILVPMDDSEMAEHALEYAVEAHPESEITVLNVVGKSSGMMGEKAALALADDTDDAIEEAAAEIFEAATEIATEAGVDIETRIEVGHPAKEIVKVAEDYDTVVIGSHSGGLLDRLLVGNIAEKVFRNAPVPVTVTR